MPTFTVRRARPADLDHLAQQIGLAFQGSGDAPWDCRASLP